MRHVLAVLVENKPGVLVRVAGLFSRRGFNIESIAVGRTMNPGISRMTISVEADQPTLEQIIKQLNKQVNTLKVTNLSREQAVYREMMLIKVKADTSSRGEIRQIADAFRAKIVDISLDSMIIEITGNNEKLEACRVLLEESVGVMELVSTGVIALTRGSKTASIKSAGTAKRTNSK